MRLGRQRPLRFTSLSAAIARWVWPGPVLGFLLPVINRSQGTAKIEAMYFDHATATITRLAPGKWL